MATTLSLKTPKGVANYPWLSKPDVSFGKERFKCGIVFENSAIAKPVIDAVNKVAADEFGAKAKVKKPLVKNEDGTILLKTQSNSKPTISDSHGEVLKKTVKLGGGSIVRLAVTLSTYNKDGSRGVTAYLDSVQLLKLVEYGAGREVSWESAADEVEDAFVAGDASGDDEEGEADDGDVSSSDDASEF
jgi:hypothetical protein